MQWYLKVLKNYVTFSGRARRKEYWMFTLINGIIGLVIYGAAIATSTMATINTPYGPTTTITSFSPLFYVYFIYILATALPSLAVFFRRLHDTNRSGWWFFIGILPLVGVIVLLIFMVSAGTEGPNDYGSDPLEEDDNQD